MPASACPLQEVSQIVAEHLDRVLSDVTSQIRYGGGILVASGELEPLEEIGRRLASLEVWTRTVPAHLLGHGERPLRITHLELRGETLWARLPNHRELDLDRSSIRGFQVHAVETAPPPEPTEPGAPASRWAETLLDTELSTISPDGRKFLTLLGEEEKPLPELWLTLYPAPPARPLRWERARFDYSILGEDKVEHSLDNFLLLIHRLIEEFPALVNREKGERLLEELDWRDVLISKPEEVANFDRWMRAWLASEQEALADAAPPPSGEESDGEESGEENPGGLP